MTTKLLTFLAFLLLTGADAALAHAIVLRSSPSEGETVAGPDLAIEIHFNSRIDGKRSRLALTGPDGARVALSLRAAPPDTLSAAAAALAPGAYRLHWQTLSVDGHLTQGDVSFRVGR